MPNTPTPKHGLLKPTYQDTRWDIPGNTNYDTIDTALPPKAGSTGQVLTKASITDYDYTWADGGTGGGGSTPAVIPEALLTDNIYGGYCTFDPWGGFEVSPFSCMADDGITQLYINSTFYGGFQNTNTVAHVWAVKYDTDEIAVYDGQQSNGSDLPANVVAKRWIGMTALNGSGAALKQTIAGDWVLYSDPAETQLGALTTAFTSIDHSAFLYMPRVEKILYGTYFTSGTAGKVITSMDSSIIESVVGQPPAAYVDGSSVDGWGLSDSDAAIWLPHNDNRVFATAADSAGLLLRGIKWRR